MAELVLTNCEDYTQWTSQGNITLSDDSVNKVQGINSMKMTKTPLGSPPHEAKLDLVSAGGIKNLNSQYTTLSMWVRKDISDNLGLRAHFGENDWDDLGYMTISPSTNGVFENKTATQLWVYPGSYYKQVININNIRYIKIDLSAWISTSTYQINIDYIIATGPDVEEQRPLWTGPHNNLQII